MMNMHRLSSLRSKDVEQAEKMCVELTIGCSSTRREGVAHHSILSVVLHQLSLDLVAERLARRSFHCKDPVAGRREFKNKLPTVI